MDRYSHRYIDRYRYKDRYIAGPPEKQWAFSWTVQVHSNWSIGDLDRQIDNHIEI